MRRTRFDDAHCPVARTADLLGDWWSPLVLRELLFGRRRFAEIEAALEISKGVLAQRLARFEAEGIVERQRYQEHPPRDDYVLTDKGTALWEVMVAMWRYGDEWLFDDGAPIELYDKRTGEEIEPLLIDAATGDWLDRASTRVRLRS